MRIALAGNPNSGKTTMYNALTGRSEKVGNWAGVTVAKKEHPIKKTYYSGSEELTIVDLPGAYSMSPFTSEESITSSYVKDEHPDAIINIVMWTLWLKSLAARYSRLCLPMRKAWMLLSKRRSLPKEQIRKRRTMKAMWT